MTLQLGKNIYLTIFFLQRFKLIIKLIFIFLLDLYRIWDFKVGSDPLETIKHHSEFVYGLDFNLHVAGQIADCGWDSLVHVFSPRSLNGSNNSIKL